MATLTATQQLRGLALPCIRGAGGYFASKTKYDVAWGDLILALMCPLGARPFKRNFGSTVTESVFSSLGPNTETLLKYAVEEAARAWCPHINIKAVDTRPSSEDPTTLQMKVTFSLREDSQSVDRTVYIPSKNLSSIINAQGS